MWLADGSLSSLFLLSGEHASYVYYTQIMQAETLAAAYRLWRRNWKGKGREYTAGALVWQVSVRTSLTRLSKACAPIRVVRHSDMGRACLGLTPYTTPALNADGEC